MKKLIAVFLCSIHFSTFTWNWDFFKPNFSSWYQSWTTLPSNQQNILIGASAGATLALLYAGWPVSQAYAKSKALKVYDEKKGIVEELDSEGKSDIEIEKHFDIAHGTRDYVRFYYGSVFNPNRKQYVTWVHRRGLGRPKDSKELFGTVPVPVVSIANTANNQEKSEYYDKNEKTWISLAKLKPDEKRGTNYVDELD